jgi:hypothetical protein
MIVSNYFRCLWHTPPAAGVLDSQAYVRDWAFKGGNQKDYDEMLKTWSFDNVEYFEPLNAALIASKHDKVSTKSVDWEQWPGVTSTKWRTVTIMGMPIANYIKYYDASPRHWGALTSKANYDFDAGVVCYIMRNQPTNLDIQDTGGVKSLITVTKENGLLSPWTGISLPDLTYEGNTYRYIIMFPTHSEKSLKPSITAPYGSTEMDIRQPVIRRVCVAGKVGDKILTGSQTGDWETVATYQGNALSAQISAAKFNANTVEDVVIIRQLESKLFITSGTIGDWWSYTDKVIANNQPIIGRIGLFAQGQQAAFLPCQQSVVGTQSTDGEGNQTTSYEGSVTIRPAKMGNLPSYFDEASGTFKNEVQTEHLSLHWRAVAGAKRDGASLEGIIEDNADTKEEGEETKLTKLGLKLVAANPLRTPILYRMSEVYKPEVVRIAHEDQPLSLLSVEIQRNENDDGNMRGASARLVVAPEQSMPFMKGNEEFQIIAAYVDDTATYYEYPVFTGRLIDPEDEIGPEIIEQPRTVTLSDDSYRLDKKYVRDKVGDVSGWLWWKVWKQTLNACGVSDDRIKINGVFINIAKNTDAFRLEGEIDQNTDGDESPSTLEQMTDAVKSQIGMSKDDIGLAPKPTTPMLKWIDYLVKKRGDWIWRIEPDGCYNALPRPAASATNSIFTIENNPVNHINSVNRVKHKRDLSKFYNEIEIIGGFSLGKQEDENTDGAADTSTGIDDLLPAQNKGVWSDKDSQRNINYRYYVGDIWEQVEEDSGEKDPEAAAKAKGKRMAADCEEVTWETEGKAVFPTQFVTCNMMGIDVPYGTLLRVIGEDRRMEATEDEIKHMVTYTCVIA